MANPVQGQQYTVVAGDTLTSIAAMAYGDPTKSTLISDANQQQAKSSDPDEVFPGETLFIPLEPVREGLRSEFQKQAISGRDPDSFTLIIEGIEVPVFSAKATGNIDTIAGMFTASFAWVPGLDERLDSFLKPFKYPKCSIYLGDTLRMTGFIYKPANKLTDTGIIKTVIGYSKTIDIVDSTAKPPYEVSKITLQQRVEDLLKTSGVNVEYNLDDDSQFDRVSIDAEEKIFDHLKKLVFERAALISETPEGNVEIFKANASSPTVGTLEEGGTFVTDWSGEWDGRKRYNTYRAIAQTPLTGSSSAVSKDNGVPKSRTLTFKANNTIDGNIQNAADWKRSKTVADALSFPLPVSGWYAPNGELWMENTIVTVISATLHLPNGFDFLIRSVDYDCWPNTCVLNLVPPDVYTGEEIIDPWE